MFNNVVLAIDFADWEFTAWYRLLMLILIWFGFFVSLGILTRAKVKTVSHDQAAKQTSRSRWLYAYWLIMALLTAILIVLVFRVDELNAERKFERDALRALQADTAWQDKYGSVLKMDDGYVYVQRPDECIVKYAVLYQPELTDPFGVIISINADNMAIDEMTERGIRLLYDSGKGAVICTDRYPGGEGYVAS